MAGDFTEELTVTVTPEMERQLGRPRKRIEDGRIRSAVIAYKVEAGSVRATNIFYGRRDYEAEFLHASSDEPVQ